MSTKANTTLIGAFVLGAVGIVVLALSFFSEGLLSRDQQEFVMFFDRTVQGLEPGAPMKLRGVKIGEVTRIESHLLPERLGIVNAVYVKVRRDEIKYGDEISDRDELLDVLIHDQGMRAQLRIQSMLTGLLYIEVDFKGPLAEMKLWGLVPGVRELPTAITEIEELSQIANRFDFDALSTSFRNILENLDAFTSDPEIQSLAGNLNNSLASVDQLVDNLDQVVMQDVKGAINKIDKLASGLNADYPMVADDLRQSMGSLQSALAKLEHTMGNASHLLSDDSPLIYEVVQTLEQLSQAAEKINMLAETVEREPEILLKGKSGG